MNDYSLLRAGRTTHLKIVVVSLIAGIMVVGVGVASRSVPSDNTIATIAGTKMQASGPVIRAGKPVTWTASDTSQIR